MNSFRNFAKLRNIDLGRVTRRLLTTAVLSGCLFRMSSFAGDPTADHIDWLRKQMEIACSFHHGSHVERLLQFFQRDGGDGGFGIAVTKENWREVLRGSDTPNSWPYAASFSLKACPLIKMDVRFQSGKFEAEPGDLIDWVSKPYLEQKHLN